MSISQWLKFLYWLRWIKCHSAENSNEVKLWLLFVWGIPNEKRVRATSESLKSSSPIVRKFPVWAIAVRYYLPVYRLHLERGHGRKIAAIIDQSFFTSCLYFERKTYLVSTCIRPNWFDKNTTLENHLILFWIQFSAIVSICKLSIINHRLVFLATW